MCVCGLHVHVCRGVCGIIALQVCVYMYMYVLCVLHVHVLYVGECVGGCMYWGGV